MDDGDGNDLGNRPDGYPVDWDVRRHRVYARDGYRCNNCGASNTEVHAHHVVPLSKGGSNDLTNLTTLCTACHTLIHPHMQEPAYAVRWVNDGANREDWGETLWTLSVFVAIIAFPFVLYWLFGAP